MTKRANGEGSCYQLSNGTWRAVDADRTVYRIGKTQREAIRKRDEELARRGVSIGRIEGKHTVAEFLDAWLKSKAASIRERTIEGYAAIISTHVTPMVGALQLRRVTTRDVQSVIDAAAEKKKSPATIRHIARLMNDAFAQAVSWKLIPVNPCSGVIVPKRARPKAQPLYDDVLGAFLRIAAADRLEALWLMLVGFGPRRGEAVGLALEDLVIWEEPIVDPATQSITTRKRGMLTIKRSLQRAGGELKFFDSKTSAGTRTIELPMIAIEAIERWMTRREEEKRAAGDRWEESGLVFCTRRGTPLEPRYVTKLFKQLLASIGAVNKLHALRHTTASIMLRDGVDVKTVQHMLGHATAAMTLDTYGHLLPGRSGVAAGVMDGALSRLQS